MSVSCLINYLSIYLYNYMCVCVCTEIFFDIILSIKLFCLICSSTVNCLLLANKYYIS